MKFIGIIILFLTIAKTFGEECNGNPNKKLPQECCKIPTPKTDILEKCIGLYKDQTEKGMANKIEHGCCISECTFNETKIYKGDGIIDKEVLTKLLTEGVDAAWKDKIPTIVNQCFKDAATHIDEFTKQFNSPPAFDDEKICHPISGFMLLCIHNMAFQKCPDSVYKKDAECDALKAYAEKCPITYAG